MSKVKQVPQVSSPVLEASSASSSPPPSPPQKRKRDEDAPQESKRAAKRRKQGKKPKDNRADTLDVELGVNHAIAYMDNRLLADHIAQRLQRFQPDLSLQERESLYLPASIITDTTGWTSPRTTDSLPAFLKHFTAQSSKAQNKAKDKERKPPNLLTAPPKPGTPHTLLLTSSGLRAADLVRTLRTLSPTPTKGPTTIAKLFAKHIKLSAAAEQLRKMRVSVGVGTPQRVADLLNEGSLRTEGLERVVVDASFVDIKGRGVLDVGEVVGPLVRLLARGEIRRRGSKRGENDEAGDGDHGKGKVELLFY